MAGSFNSLPLLKRPSGIDALLVVAEIADLVFGQEFQLGDADAVFAGDHAVQRTRQRHDARHRRVRILQHLVVVGIDRDVGVHVAVAGVHVQRHEHPAAQHLLVDRVAFLQHRAERRAVENLAQRRAHFLLPRDAHGAVLHAGGTGWRRAVAAGVRRIPLSPCRSQAPPARAAPRRAACPGAAAATTSAHAVASSRSSAWCARSSSISASGMSSPSASSILPSGRLPRAKKLPSSARNCSLFLIDSSMLMRSMPSVYSPMPVQRDHHVFVDLEGVGVLGDRGGAGAVEPEFLARLRADRDEAFADARVGHAHHFRGGLRHRVFIVADDVAEQHHLRQHAALGLGGVADRAQVALVQVFQAGQDRAALAGLGFEVILDLDDRRHRLARLAEEFQADGARELRHLVQDPARRGDQAVAAFLLDAGQAGRGTCR